MKRLALVTALLVLAACASQPPSSPERVVSDNPSWFPKGPDGFYGAGMATANELQFAVDKATLNAKVSLADRVHGSVSALLKIHTNDRGSTAERVAKNLVNEVDLAGYEIKDSKIVTTENGFRVYMLLKYEATTQDADMQKAIKDLEAEVKAKSAPVAPDEPPPIAPVPLPPVTRDRAVRM